jgi:FkbM family methyltransferase
MGTIKQFCIKKIAFLLGNKFSQEMLQRVVTYANYFMGIGAGANTASSGEVVILRRLKCTRNTPIVIFDVGANKGQFLKLALENSDHLETQIHCFEPSQFAFSILTKQAFAYKNVILNNFGLGAKAAQTELYYDNLGSGLASLTQRRLDHFGIDHNKHETVSIETIDDYCIANGIKKIDLLKIDIEGHELDALRGATKMFQSRSIFAVTFEFGGCNIDTRTFMQDYWYFFKELGMTLSRITSSGYLHRIENYSEALEQMITTNYIAEFIQYTNKEQ